MNRREFMQCAALLVSGAAASQVGFTVTQKQQHFMTAANYNVTSVNYFTDAQRRVVSSVAEIIIPATDTPGAIDAGVPKFIELMVADWFDDDERAIFNRGLVALTARSKQLHGKLFYELLPEQQEVILEEMEAAAGDSSWYEFGNTQREFVSDAPFICQIKELTIWGFFTSELGGTQVLRYEAMPMKFDGNQKLERDGSSWASSSF